MRDTTTHIYWPSHLKIDAKSKKGNTDLKQKLLTNVREKLTFVSTYYTDVHVKILGKLDDAKIARDRVLEKLDARVRF